jgi:hypothetical protein
MEVSTLIQKLLPFAQRVRDGLNFSVPPEVLPEALWVGVALLGAALVTGVFGAKLARGGLTVALGLGGLVIGLHLARHFEVPHIAGALFGFASMAMVGFLTHRLWIGLSVGALVSALAMLAFGGETLWNAVQDFPRQHVVINDEFLLPNDPTASADPAAQLSLQQRTDKFYGDFRISHPSLSTQILAVGTVALAAGFCWGTWFTRGALIVACALIGTTLFGASLTAFAEAFAPAGWENRVAAHPQMTLGFAICCFMLSNLVQYRFTQPPKTSGPPSGEPKKPK